MIRVLIVEDSVTQREIFKRLLANDDELTVVAEARDGNEALAKVREHLPDVVLMDIHMPDMDGIAATRSIMQHCPVPIVVASATLKKCDVDLAMQAYEAGAVSVIEKPEGAVLLHLEKMAPELRRELLAAAKAKVVRRGPPAGAKAPEQRRPLAAALPAVAAVGVCASTGGPPVLAQIFAQIPKPYPLPLLLVQHISHGFEEGFAKWLTQSTGQRVALATSGQPLTPGVWLAPGGRHLTLAGPARIELPRGSDADIHCPSGNPLFASLAEHLGPRSAGVLLTGMGDDGAAGLLTLKQAGGLTVIQEEASCLIWGMPKVAQQQGAAVWELDPQDIARTLTRLSQEPAKKAVG
jgi:two-component system chemotaxis response regulator CheB